MQITVRATPARWCVASILRTLLLGGLLAFAVAGAVTEALTLTEVQSRKSHNTASFDLPIDTAQSIGGAVTVESRAIGAGHQIVFQFDAPISPNAAGTPAAVDEISGLVRLTTTDAVLYNVVLPNLAGLAALHPQLRLELLASYEMANLSKRDADIAIRATTRPPEHLIGHKLGRLGMAMYGSTKLVKSAGKTAVKNKRPPTDLSAFDWVALDDAIPEHPSIQWRKKNYPKVVPRFFVNSHVAVGEMVRAGLGIGMLSTYQSKDDPNLVALTPPLNDCVIELWILTHPESRHLRRISAVYNYFAKAIKYVAS